LFRFGLLALVFCTVLCFWFVVVVVVCVFFLMLFLVMGDLYCSIFCYLIYPSTLLFDLKKEKYKSLYVYITLVCLFHVSFFSISKRNLLKGAQGVVEPYTTKTVQIYHHSENNYSPSIKDCSNLPNHLHENRTNKKRQTNQTMTTCCHTKCNNHLLPNVLLSQ
jgi:hypothetical protein